MTPAEVPRRASHVPPRDRFRSACVAAVALNTTFAAYLSWVPFSFQRISAETLGEALRAALVPSVISRVNLLANVVLFIPIGLFGSGAFGLEIRSGWNRRLRCGVVLLVSSLLLSVAIEGVQVFLPGRTPASSDVMAHVGGTILGIAGWLVIGGELREWMRNRQHQTEPRLLLLHAAVGCLIIGTLFPLDVTLSLSTLAQKYRDGGILLVPFRGQGLQTGLLQDMAEKMLFAAPLGAWCVFAWTPLSRPRRLVAAIVMSTGFLAALEICQVVIMSRVADATDVLTGAAGASLGAWIAASRSISRPGAVRRSRLTVAGLVLSIALYIVFNWSPFDFKLSQPFFDARWPELMQVPFRSYYDHSEVKAIADFAIKFAMSLPIGLFAGLVGDRGRHEFKRLLFASSSILAAAFFLSIEVGQIFLPSRFPDVTDVLIAVLGFVCGGTTAQILRDWRRTPGELAPNRGMSP